MALRGGPAGVHPPFGRVTGGGRRGAKTAGTTPTTGCATPPGGVGVDRRREMPRIVAASLRDDHFSVPLKKKWGFSPFFGMWDRIIVVARVSSNNAGNFSASIHAAPSRSAGLCAITTLSTTPTEARKFTRFTAVQPAVQGRGKTEGSVNPTHLCFF